MRELDYRGVEWVLYNYRQLLAKLSNAKKSRESILATEVGIGAVTYDSVSGGITNKISRPVENAAEHREKLLVTVDKEIKELESLIHRTETSLEALPEEEQALLKAYYIEKWSWKKIAGKRNYSISWCKKIRKKGLKITEYRTLQSIFLIKTLFLKTRLRHSTLSQKRIANVVFI